MNLYSLLLLSAENALNCFCEKRQFEVNEHLIFIDLSLVGSIVQNTRKWLLVFAFCNVFVSISTLGDHTKFNSRFFQVDSLKRSVLLHWDSRTPSWNMRIL